MIKKLIIMGPPGSGKGTQSVVLANEHEFLHIATGDIIRDNIARGTTFGQQSVACTTRGELVPDALVIAMIEDYLAMHPSEKIVWDGFPRTIAQAIALDQMLARNNQKIEGVINLVVSEAHLQERIAGRLTCVNCGNTYHIVKRPPVVINKCDACGGELQSRSDDSIDIYKTRLAAYHKWADQLVRYYEDQHKISQVGADGDLTSISSAIWKVIVDDPHLTS